MTESERKKLHNEKCKQQGVCPQCGKKTDDTVWCKECTAKQSEYRRIRTAWYREHHICPICKTQNLFGDEKICVECRADMANKATIRRQNQDKEEYNAYMRQYRKELWDKRRERGLCTKCGKTITDKRYVMCAICRGKATKSRKPKTIIPTGRTVEGLCYFCSKSAKEGYKTCEKHYQMCIEKTQLPGAIEGRKKLGKQFINYFPTK